MKIKNIKYFVYLLLGITIVNASCKKDWLDVKSDIKQTVPTTLQDFEYLLNEYYVMNNKAPGLGEVGSDGHYIPESAWPINGLYTNMERNAYTWTNNLPNLDEVDWAASYKAIFRCNLVLEGLKKLNPSQEALKYNSVKGNALFHKAKNYYDLAQIYAQPYQSSSAATDMGIPLKEGIDVTELSKRSSVKEVYDRILEDLRFAAKLLPELPELKTKGSKCGAFALLARTYLTMGDYVNAGMYADSSLNLYNKLIDFNTISITATNMGRYNIETIFHAELYGDGCYSTWVPGYGFVDQSLYDLYEVNDLRKTRFFNISGTNISFKGNYSNSGIPFNGLAVDEQYLIRAECFARAGNVNGAMKDLNDLRKTRWNNAVTYPLSTAIDAEEALRQVLLERRKELLYRGLRWTDLRRLNIDPRFKTTLTRTIAGITYTLEPGSYKYTLPIPDHVMNLAPQMKQSPGW